MRSIFRPTTAASLQSIPGVYIAKTPGLHHITLISNEKFQVSAPILAKQKALQ
jgi:hypothetical protein